jgi:hypothetical protein
MDMRLFAVWCLEYPEDGSVLVDAWTEKGAVRRFRRMTIGRGRPDDTYLGVAEMTPELLALREEAAK